MNAYATNEGIWQENQAIELSDSELENVLGSLGCTDGGFDNDFDPSLSTSNSLNNSAVDVARSFSLTIQVCQTFHARKHRAHLRNHVGLW